jgi:hypothetical protein
MDGMLFLTTITYAQNNKFNAGQRGAARETQTDFVTAL